MKSSASSSSGISDEGTSSDESNDGQDKKYYHYKVDKKGAKRSFRALFKKGLAKKKSKEKEALAQIVDQKVQSP